ncbi:hypothetical protein BDR22DRAFT_824152 [Usnea florida]
MSQPRMGMGNTHFFLRRHHDGSLVNSIPQFFNSIGTESHVFAYDVLEPDAADESATLLHGGIVTIRFCLRRAVQSGSSLGYAQQSSRTISQWFSPTYNIRIGFIGSGSGFGLVNETNIPTISPLNSMLGNSIMNTSISDSNVTTPSPSLQLVNSTQSNMRTIQLPALKQTSEQVSSSSNAEHNIKLHRAYTPGGAAFHDVQIYNDSLQLLVQIAQVADQDGTIWPLFSTYSDKDDLTLNVSPIGFVKHSKLS